MFRFLQVFLFFVGSLVFGQRYLEIDNRSQNVKFKGDLSLLVSELTEDLDGDEEKARAIYFWITENIKYDFKKFNKGKKVEKFRCKGKDDCLLKRQKIENKLIEKVLRQRKGICSGYAVLFKRMCDLANVNCQIIEGYVKTKGHHAGKMGVLDHAWNSVLIDNETFYVDATWGAGYCETDGSGKLKSFVKKRNDFYWFTPVEKFSIDHFPRNPERILNFEMSKEEFKNQPFIENDIIPFINHLEPESGILKVKKNDTISFEFDYLLDVDKIQINTNVKRNPKIYTVNKKKQRILNEKAMERQEYVSYQKENDSYAFEYIVENENLKFIEILFDYHMKIRYVVEVEGQ